MIQGVYRFTYRNGMQQEKVLIKHLWWLYIKLLPEKVYKRAIKCITEDNEWFTDQSPLYEAIGSGKLRIYNGSYVPCTVELLH